tara:strand:+ start:309 stop:494 length:186 start_codon:yes stop_codon:yes gene_type:complete
MLEVIITYRDRDDPIDTYSILTYLRGEGYWQFLTTDGTTICVPDSAVKKVEIMPISNGEEK